uniref:Uncharacterized protein n=1 Tax=Trieres chinensis TaxID=1514140 RepID=A0A7S2ECA4_TRICV|mmetsp:Transcript_16642/g.34114  ORF Transcript_16642/g.34114 Transcript_16642/m.34114 type:complete len:267 (+) Transcript_16642:98-898(+)
MSPQSMSERDTAGVDISFCPPPTAPPRRARSDFMVREVMMKSRSNSLGKLSIYPRSIMTVRTCDESMNSAISELLRSEARTRRMMRQSFCSSISGGDLGSSSLAWEDESEGGASGGLVVSFDQVEIRDYPVEPGDNPSCSSGPPLTISWEHGCSQKYHLDAYETQRKCIRRDKNQMIVPPGVRMMRLKDAGFSNQEIAVAAREAKETRKHMIKTSQKKEAVCKLEEKVELTKRSLDKLVHRKKNKENKDLIKRGLECQKYVHSTVA